MFSDPKRKNSGGSRALTRGGFTLLELMLAVSILALVAAVTHLTFATVVTAWRRGTAMSDNMHHGDFVADQLVMALRSCYYPDAKGSVPQYGFRLEDNGDDAYSSDAISWVKLGGALVGKSDIIAATPHRVKFWVDDGVVGERAAFYTAWRLQGQPEDFDPEELEPVELSRRLVGFNCRTAGPDDFDEDTGEIDWQGEWESTNSLPLALELTFYLAPPDEGGSPIELQRAVEIPVAHLSGPWRSTGTVVPGVGSRDNANTQPLKRRQNR